MSRTATKGLPDAMDFAFDLQQGKAKGPEGFAEIVKLYQGILLVVSNAKIFSFPDKSKAQKTDRGWEIIEKCDSMDFLLDFQTGQIHDDKSFKALIEKYRAIKTDSITLKFPDKSIARHISDCVGWEVFREDHQVTEVIP